MHSSFDRIADAQERHAVLLQQAAVRQRVNSASAATSRISLRAQLIAWLYVRIAQPEYERAGCAMLTPHARAS